MKPVSISLLTICGIDELPTHQTRSVSHVLSVLDPERPDPDAFAAYAPHERTILRFHDIIEELPGQMAPTSAHVEEVLAFGEGLKNTADARKEGHLLVHCHMGVSRSTAAMLTLMAQTQPDVAEDELFAALRAIRPIAWPNSRMIAFADDLLGRDGRLVSALNRHYRYQLEHDDHFDEWMTSLGRAREVALGKAA